MPTVRDRWADPAFLSSIEGPIKDFLLSKKPAQGLDLRGLILGLDGQPSFLADASFANAKGERIDAADSRFSCDFFDAELKDCIFDRALFDTCIFKGGKFFSTSFEASEIASPFLNDALFQACRFREARLTSRRLHEYGGRRVRFRECDFSRTKWKKTYLRATTFINCRFEGAVFESCYFAAVRFEGEEPPAEAFVNCEKT